MQARVIGWRSAAVAITSSHPPARSLRRSALSSMVSGSRRSRKAAKSTIGPGPPVKRRTAHPTRAKAIGSSCAPDNRIDTQSARRSELTRSPANQLSSAASIRARRCRQPSGPRSSRSSKAPRRPATLASRAAWTPSAFAQSSMTEVSGGFARGPGGKSSGSSSSGPGRNQRSSSRASSSSSMVVRGSSISSVKLDALGIICAKYCAFAHYPSDFGAVAFALYIVCARDCRWNHSDRAWRKETKGFWTSTTRTLVAAGKPVFGKLATTNLQWRGNTWLGPANSLSLAGIFAAQRGRS